MERVRATSGGDGEMVRRPEREPSGLGHGGRQIGRPSSEPRVRSGLGLPSLFPQQSPFSLEVSRTISLFRPSLSFPCPLSPLCQVFPFLSPPPSSSTVKHEDDHINSFWFWICRLLELYLRNQQSAK